MKRYNPLVILVLIALMLNGCTTTQKTYSFVHNSNVIKGMVSDIPDKNEISKILKNGLQSIQVGEYEEAIELFNKGLRLDPSNGYLHFLNAFSYHLISQSGNTKMREIALTGYITALKFDQSNYLASYLLGNIYFDKKKYLKAQNQFAYGLLYAPKNAYLLRSLATASYYCSDITLSHWAAKKAYKLDPKNLANIKNLMFAQAANGKNKAAKKSFHEYKNLSSNTKETAYIKNLRFDYMRERLNGWEGFYKQRVENLFGFSPDNSQNSNDDEMQDIGNDFSTSDMIETQEVTQKDTQSNDKNTPLPKMALVDVVIIETEEVKTQSKGMNLLEGLQATLGGSIQYNNDPEGSFGGGTKAWSITPSLDIAGLTYNFNIFNDGENKAEILARPSLLAIEGKSSKFYSGSTLHVALNNDSGDSSIEDVEIGINLAVIPHFYPNDIVKIQVHADRSLLVPLDEEVGFTSSSQTTRTSVDATAVLKIDETLILSGLTENSKNNSKSGVPFLQEVPGVQYFFSKNVNSEKKKSILILLTPRKVKQYNNENDYDVSIQKKKDRLYTNQLKKQEKIVTTNIDAALTQSANNSLYQQFRAGDLKLEAWNNEDTLLGSIRRMLGFLYY